VRSHIFASAVQAPPADGPMALQNPKLLRVALNGQLMARQGAMVAYQGAIEFAYEGSGAAKFLKKALTGEGVPLMTCTGRGDLFLAQDADEVHLIDLDGDSVTVNGRNVLAFEPGLQWDIRRIEGAGILSGGLFNTVFTGRGRLAVTAHGSPVVLDTSVAPTFVDMQSAIAWSSNLQTSVKRTAGMKALIGLGSGEAFQLAFAGPGFVVVQASEGPTVPPHEHPGN
jgi:uncharacterized protein (AIM24 family)